MAKTSPFAPKRFPALPAVEGIRLAAISAGLRYSGRDDLMLAVLRPRTQVAGVFTRSTMAAPPVNWCRQQIGRGTARALIVNSGNANAFTGPQGVECVRRTVKAVGRLVGCAPQDVYVSSTGVIGEPLDDAKIAAALPKLQRKLSPTGWRKAANAIMTTDTFAKGATRVTEIAGKPVRINGIAKGSGMIMPNMATMLAYVATDAALPGRVLQSLLRAANRDSFNSITVDSDTSTSDTVLLFATGVVRPRPAITKASDPRLKPFKAALTDLMAELAQQIVRDGEGASRFITVNVSGAETRDAAHRIAMSIANSPLVKTAIAGGDANWGRIVMAVGKAGEKADPDKLDIRVGGTPITANGMVRADYDETPLARYMAGREIEIAVDVGIGRGRARVWTCDLTHGYIEINADYRS